MTAQEFITSIRNGTGRPQSQRPGQWAFNRLLEIRPDLAEAVRGGQLDPFHQDKRLGVFEDFLRAAWEVKRGDALSPSELRASLAHATSSSPLEAAEPEKNLGSRLRQYEVDDAGKEVPRLKVIEHRAGWSIAENLKGSLVGQRDDLPGLDELWCAIEPGRPENLIVSLRHDREHAPRQFSVPLWVLRRIMEGSP